MTDDLPPLRDVVGRYGLRARKSLGQNFLFDLNLTRRIARSAGDLGAGTIIEVGPGPGGLTRALLAEGAARLIVIEQDERFLPAIAEIARRYPGRVTIIHDDAMDVAIERLAAEPPLKIVANLPYNIGTPLLVRWLEASWPPPWSSLTLMFQREVANRIVATPDERADYGRLAVLAGWRTRARILFDVPPAAFTPPPKVTSSIVQLIPRVNPSPACNLKTLERVTASAFGQRRKTLRSSLKTLMPEPEALLEKAGIDPELRAEQVPVEGFARMAALFDAREPA
jgi:16S rRNA (adenine1518-N6/adenine1519-N6)-dimethyltransferase